MSVVDAAARQICGNILPCNAQMTPAGCCILQSTSCVEGCRVAGALEANLGVFLVMLPRHLS